MIFLGIESSCDECSASVVEVQNGQLWVRSLATFSQVEIHRPYGGVVPEIASRNHLETVLPMIDQAMKESGAQYSDLTAVCTTNRPGLVGALLVGVSAAKSVAYATKKPLVPVHHLEGHCISPFLNDSGHQASTTGIQYPLLILLVSGGHTQLILSRSAPEIWQPDFLSRYRLGQSRDDAAGEAFDKTAKLMGFPYPGGVWIDRWAKHGNQQAFPLPRALPSKDVLDFSFSGLKTAVSETHKKLLRDERIEALPPPAAPDPQNPKHQILADLCASTQEAIVDALLQKTWIAARKYQARSLAIVGGVAANSRLRSEVLSDWEKHGLTSPPLFPSMQYCTDNAAMIAGAGAYRFMQGHRLEGEALLTLNAFAHPDH